MAALMGVHLAVSALYVVTEAKASKLKFATANDVRAPVYREVFCDEDDDRLWNRYCGIGSGASSRYQHARSSCCPRELFASLHGCCRVSCRIQRLRGESALCPSCGTTRRSPHRSPAPLLNREDHGCRARQVTNRVSSVSSGCRRGPAAAPQKKKNNNLF